jgi:hypothetical protein
MWWHDVRTLWKQFGTLTLRPETIPPGLANP